MINYAILSFDVLFSPLLAMWSTIWPSDVMPEPFEIWLIGLTLGLLPGFHTLSFSPMGLLVRFSRIMCAPLDQPAGTHKRAGLTIAIKAAALSGATGWVLTWLLPIWCYAVLASLCIASLCNITAVPLRAYRASRRAKAGELTKAHHMLAPLATITAKGDANEVHRRALETSVSWFALGLCSSSFIFLLFGLPGLLSFTALRVVARHVDRRGYAADAAVGPVLLENISSYAFGWISAALIWASSIVAPGTHLGRASAGMRYGSNLMTFSRPFKIHRFTLAPTLIVIAFALNLQLMGPSVERPLKVQSDPWVGPISGTPLVTHTHVLQTLWLLTIAVLMLILAAFGYGTIQSQWSDFSILTFLLDILTVNA